MRYHTIKLPVIGFFMVAFCFSGPAAAPVKDSLCSLRSPNEPAVSDTAKPAISDSLKSTASQKVDSLSSPVVPPAANASPAADQKDQPQKLTLIKRTYGGRQQVLLATGMMIFVVGIMTMAQQWNPR